jgi:hypothetical protein
MSLIVQGRGDAREYEAFVRYADAKRQIFALRQRRNVGRNGVRAA